MKGNIGQLMKQAQQMQENMRRMQESLATLEVEGQSGAGMVKVQMTCKYEVKRVASIPRWSAMTARCSRTWWPPRSTTRRARSRPPSRRR